jgi:hypothetical protein
MWDGYTGVRLHNLKELAPFCGTGKISLYSANGIHPSLVGVGHCLCSLVSSMIRMILQLMAVLLDRHDVW